MREILRDMHVTLLPEQEQEIFSGVRTLLLPGHSVGLQGLVIDSGNERLVLASDALWSARGATRAVPDVAFFDSAKAQTSLDRALEAGDVFYPGHDIFEGKLVKAGGAKIVECDIGSGQRLIERGGDVGSAHRGPSLQATM